MSKVKEIKPWKQPCEHKDTFVRTVIENRKPARGVEVCSSCGKELRRL